MGTLLFCFWVSAGATLTAVSLSDSVPGWWAKAGFGAGAVSSFLLGWWSGRFWYAAFSERRRAEPVAEPDSWPWLLPPVVIGVALAVTGVR
ncbi:hypothetical protein ADL00_25465 [Streptomyces sp. AS58]|uniref:hypothetical protein n=1 Tax=Streptomyces sp. AS58 TaxID=1519489 RepID=UPI0006B02ED1|nr:hypothetical protein [Streptomyces sp. AS58]KOV59959.1 hypothetical protein ADL00_25465 [Streptomyces sp. AS58]